MRHKLQTITIYCNNSQKIKSSKKNMLCERFLNFDQWKTFAENYKQIIVWLWFFYKFTLSLATFLEVHSNSKEISYLHWQNKYPNFNTTCHIKLRFFLWTKLPKNLLLAKYLVSVAVVLIISVIRVEQNKEQSKVFSNKILPIEKTDEHKHEKTTYRIVH